MSFSLLIFDPDSTSVASMKSAFTDLPSVAVQKVEKMRYLEPPGGIDVLYLPLAVAECFGSRPLIHKSLVLPTTSSDQEGGLPPFIVTGTCLAPDDTRGPEPEMKLLLAVVFDSIVEFNSRSNLKLRRVGFWGYDLLKGLTAPQLRQIVLEVVPGMGKPS
jgi:hypothetical protein